ncbi:hypothetical protein [Pseudonocardia humida]|uniref:Ig-like domain-containing protein n=1 Tax=Pseudonocardia humida TaxID=2800819 RepID=A0ABT0ZVQ1_9PSEU|nr:hypothetical protein [Pseudonocardia humida]MCO1654738.1 hypothetical protein [Pseudonocardia humida]
MTRFRTIAGRAAAAALLAGAAVLGGAGAAAAAPVDGSSPLPGATSAVSSPDRCSTVPFSTGVNVLCNSGSGQYRASVRCDRNNLPDHNRYGPWMRVNPFGSAATCNAEDRAFDYGYQVR